MHSASAQLQNPVGRNLLSICGNDATKKTQKTLLKQNYENFTSTNNESIDSIFTRLQKIVSQLIVFGIEVDIENLNMKFLRSLPFEFHTNVIV